MNLRRELATDRRSWLLFSVLAFVLFGFIHPFNEGVESKIGPSHFWGVLEDGVRHWDRIDSLPRVVVYALIVAVPAVTVGWLSQAVLVVVRDAATRVRHRDDPVSN